MKKWNWMLLALLMLCVPAAGSAQDLPELFGDVYESVGQGLRHGAALVNQAVQQELTLTMETDSARLEEGKTVCLTMTAGNPLPQETKVSFSLSLPERVKTDGDMQWEMILPAAQMNEETGELVPSQTAVTRMLALTPGGDSEQIDLSCEMAMGTRFYRAGAQLALCVPRISAGARLEGTKDGRLQPGDAFAYCVVLSNSGDAPKDVALEMTLPADVTLQQLPEGFAQEGQRITGSAWMEAASGEPAEKELRFDMAAKMHALQDDQDALRLMAPVLRVDNKRVSMPQLQLCAPRISARLLPEKESMETGEESVLSIVLVNSGLAAGRVRLSCVLPQGLLPVQEKTESRKEQPEEAAILPGGDDLPGAGEAVAVQADAAAPVMTQQQGTLVFDVYAQAARETAEGVIAHTQVIEIPVRAQMPQERMTDTLMGASLAWTVDEGSTQLGQAVALRVHPKEVLGMTRADWNGVFWTGILLLVTLVCLYAAVRREKKEETYCFE